jgi:hypothetical protein
MSDDSAAPPQPPEPGAGSFWRLEKFSEVGRGRIVRLGIMILVLIALFVATLYLRARTTRQEQQRQQRVAAALEGARGVIGLLTPDLTAAELQDLLQQGNALLSMVTDLDPDNVETDRLAVPLYYATGHLDDAIAAFNSLDVFPIAEELDSKVWRAARPLKAFDMFTPESASSILTQADRHYIRACGLLWGLAHEITATALSEEEKALRLCRWMALHVLPVAAGGPPADPYVVVWRGYASPAQAVWTYAELARQAGLRARVVVPPAADGDTAEEGLLVQVFPTEGSPLLVAPYAGVPVLDVGSAAMLAQEQVVEAPNGLARLRELPGGMQLPRAERLSEAKMQIAVAIEACLPRLLVFDYLLEPLPQRPEIGLDVTDVTDEELVLWDEPIATHNEISAGGTGEAISQDVRHVGPAQPGRMLQLHGLHATAAAAYAQRRTVLADQMAEAETEESVAALRDGLEFVAFLAASNALDGGDHGAAAELAQDYLDQYPDGRWRPLAILVRAEALTADGKAAEVEGLWAELPEPRRLYGALRARGLLAGSPALVTKPAPAAAEGDQPETP